MENLFSNMSGWDLLLMYLVIGLYYAAPFAVLVPIIQSLTNWKIVKRIPVLKQLTMSYWIFLLFYPAILFIMIYGLRYKNDAIVGLFILSPYITCFYYYLIVRNGIRKKITHAVFSGFSSTEILFQKQTYFNFLTFKLKDHEKK